MVAQDMNQAAGQIKESRKAAASGWIGSMLEYYDFSIWVTSHALSGRLCWAIGATGTGAKACCLSACF